jgi:hypothetical protein
MMRTEGTMSFATGSDESPVEWLPRTIVPVTLRLSIEPHIPPGLLRTVLIRGMRRKHNRDLTDFVLL